MRKIYNLIAAFLLSLILTFSSCKTKEYVEVPVETIKTEYVHHTDSIYLLDSINTYILQKNDTVFIRIDKYKIKTIHKIDTVCKTDSIPIVVYVDKVKEVNKVYVWLKILMCLGGVGILLILGFILNKFKLWKLLF